MAVEESLIRELAAAKWINDDILHLPRFFNSKILLPHIEAVLAEAPLRQMATPSGKKMSAQMTNAGRVGWVSDKKGYRYEPNDPRTAKPWPAIPSAIATIAREACEIYGYIDYSPDACLINRYRPDAQMSAHQDKDEYDFTQPVVSVSLGASAHFRIGGDSRKNDMIGINLDDGDVLVFGRSKRLAYHAVGRPKKNRSSLLNGDRICCTCRVAL